MDYSLSTKDGKENLTIFFSNGEIRTVATTHPNYDDVREGLLYEEEAEETIREWSDDAFLPAANQLTRVSERITVQGDSVFFDGTLINTNLSRHLHRTIMAGEDAAPLALFMEKLALNPSDKSRRHLFTWMDERNFTLANDGDLIGYKGVQNVSNNLSVSSGQEKVYVELDGAIEEHVGHIPNPVGATVWMDRAQVDPDRENTCSVGLHVGAHRYAAGFGAKHLVLKVNPRDVVEVPRDSNGEKMRVCRYVVLSEDGATEIAEPTYYVATLEEDEYDSDVWEDDEDDFDYEREY